MNPLVVPSLVNAQGISDDDSLPTRRSLLSRLRDLEDTDSWRTFFDNYWRLIYNVARKSGLGEDVAQEVVQETVIAVARKIPAFRYDPTKGSFKQWLLLITRRRIQDQLRRQYRSLRASDIHHDAEELPSSTLTPDAQVDAAWETEWRENLFQAALAKVRHQVNPKHYQVFDCCVLQNLGASDVARMLGLSTAQIYLIKHRMSLAIKRAVKQAGAQLERPQSC